MSTFEVLIRPIDEVRDHPNADRLSLIRVLGYDAIAAKDEDGNHRFEVGEPICYIPEAAVVPEDVLKAKGYWKEDAENPEKSKGMLAGKAGDRVKAIRLRGVISQGLVVKLDKVPPCPIVPDGLVLTRTGVPANDPGLSVKVGDDVAEFLGITKYEPPIPVGMSGEVASAYDFAMDYDIENWQNFPGFLDNEIVEATEKLHGTCFRICYHPDARHDDLFEGGSVAVSSKGLGAKGLVFKDNDANAGVLYVRVARELELTRRVRELGERLGVRVDLFGEIFGRGVQDLHYGSTKPEFRAFDIALNRAFVGNDPDCVVNKDALFAELGVERVPVLYSGPWDEAVLVEHRDGKTTLGGSCIREGIVVTAIGDQSSRDTAQGQRLRPTLKMVSPDYLTRKGEVTEFN